MLLLYSIVFSSFILTHSHNKWAELAEYLRIRQQLSLQLYPFSISVQFSCSESPPPFFLITVPYPTISQLCHLLYTIFFIDFYPSGLFNHVLRYFPIWFRFRRDIQLCKNSTVNYYTGIIDIVCFR